MAQLDPNIILQAGRVQPIDPGQLLERRAQIQLRNLGLQRQEQQDRQAAEQQQLARNVGSAYASGDAAGARRMAAEGGNLDLIGKLDQMDDAGRKRAFDISQGTAPLLLSLKRVAPPMRAQALQQLAPDLIARGFTPEHIQELAQPGVLSDQYLDSQGNAAMTIAQYQEQNKPYTLDEGAKRFNGDNQLVAEGNPKFHAVTTPEGGTTTIFGAPGSAPTQGGGGPASSGGGGPLSIATLLPAIKAQESRGNYMARNPETGALGAYQVMPETGRVLAARLGLPWQPALMTQASAQARQYQDQIGQAAVQEAIDNSGGDPRTAAMYYHGGSNRDIWGPKTRQYADEVTGRLTGDGSQRQGGTLTIRGNPKPAKAPPAPPSGYRWTAEGNLEPIPGGPAAAGTGTVGTKQQQGLARMKLTALTPIEAQLKRVETANANLDKGGFSGPLGGLVPGGLDTESAVFDKAVAQLGPLMRALTRVPGEGASSDYESRLAQLAQLSRSDKKEARTEAIAGMHELIDNIRASYQEFLGQPQSGGGNIPTLSPDQARNIPKGTRFRTTDGRVMVKQ